MEFWQAYLIFLAKSVTVVVVVLIIISAIAAAVIRIRHQGRGDKGHLEIEHLNRHYESMTESLKAETLSKKAFKHYQKSLKKQNKSDDANKRKIFVIDFHGDIRAVAVASLREEITAVLSVADEGDEVLLRLESQGGVVHGYGLAASQLLRLKKDPRLTLTVAVDMVAASGGYMMACVADRILAAPFAILGSIGVLAQVPNINRLLRRHNIDYEQFTAGDYKRTVTMLGENSNEDREKFQEQIEDTHQLFKTFVKEQRSVVDIDQVATGEHWYGVRALDQQLVDELRTSDDYLLECSHGADLYKVCYQFKPHLAERLLVSVKKALTNWRG